MTPVTTPRDTGLCLHTGLTGSARAFRWAGMADFRVLITWAGSPPHCQQYRPGDKERDEERGRRYELRGKTPEGRVLAPPPSKVSFLLLPPLQPRGYQLECHPADGHSRPARGQLLGRAPGPGGCRRRAGGAGLCKAAAEGVARRKACRWRGSPRMPSQAFAAATVSGRDQSRLPGSPEGTDSHPAWPGAG